MAQFKELLQQEFLRRTTKNGGYSLRAYAKFLDMSHATLSTMLAGKRTITPATITKLAKKLGLGPQATENYLNPATNEDGKTQNYHVIQEDAFNSISEWYFDAILQLSLIPKINLEPNTISSVLSISKLEARLALETLERLELLKKNKNGKWIKTQKNSINYLDPDFTNVAMRKYQKSILEKSLEALDNLPRSERDHTSTMMAVQKKDLTQVKELIKKFRHDLDKYLQRDGAKFDEIYQLQMSFFPITNLTNKKNEEKK
ncbi:MAG: TIGR02147 family protein [Bdellovibrionota bacterium]